NLFGESLNTHVSIVFNYFDENVFISEMTSSYNYNDIHHTNTMHVLSQKFSEFNMDSAEYWGVNHLAVNPYIYYDPDEWAKLNLKKDDDIEKIQTDLASEIPLETQFKDNSGKRLETPSRSTS